MKKQKLNIFLIGIIIFLICFHIYRINELKVYENKLIDAFQSGRFDEFQSTMQRQMANNSQDTILREEYKYQFSEYK